MADPVTGSASALPLVLASSSPSRLSVLRSGGIVVDRSGSRAEMFSTALIVADDAQAARLRDRRRMLFDLAATPSGGTLTE